jgi:alkaline phosphatase D
MCGNISQLSYLNIMKSNNLLFFAFLIILTTLSCTNERVAKGPYFGNGVHNGWADQHSIAIWTRLTKNPEGNGAGTPFMEISSDQHEALRTSTNRDSIHTAQIPRGLSLDDMEGACPGAAGEVKLTYYPDNQQQTKIEVDWTAVDVHKNYTVQWHLQDLKPNTSYNLMLEARAVGEVNPSDTLKGRFKTAPDSTYTGDIRFCVVTCHDYIRRDDPVNGHKIYPAMEKLNPDFYAHTGDVEYYDKPNPYAMTEELMRFKWDRLFALPYQRDFWSLHTTYFMKDDHDVLSDDAYPGMTYGTVSYERGLVIFDQEQFPSNDLPYKTVRWGKDLQIWMVEGRNYRSKNTDPDGPEKTIWGDQQKKWLFETISESPATYKVLISSTPILGPDRNQKKDNYSNENFHYEAEEIREFLNQQKNLFICVGDRHWQYVTHPAGTHLWEFSAGPGSDSHAGGWQQEEVRPEHRFLRVKGGFLMGEVKTLNGAPILTFQHYDVDGNMVHEEVFNAALD